MSTINTREDVYFIGKLMYYGHDVFFSLFRLPATCNNNYIIIEEVDVDLIMK